uniref:hypothetical protein n=1 Tax=Burkholderia sp. AU33423 TaxID=2015355 RepID=UPI00117EA335|nr:hypothetical protein [Burkholderia sp. AU33423]
MAKKSPTRHERQGDGKNDRDWRLVNEVLDQGHRDRLMRMNRGNRDCRERMDEGDDDPGPIDLFHFAFANKKPYAVF